MQAVNANPREKSVVIAIVRARLVLFKYLDTVDYSNRIY